MCLPFTRNIHDGHSRIELLVSDHLGLDAWYVRWQIGFSVTEIMLDHLLQNGLATKVEKSRKQVKERKNRAKKLRGTKKSKAAGEAAKKKK